MANKHLFKWARLPSPPIPSCISSNTFGVQGFTTSLCDSLAEITAYFSGIYKADEYQPPRSAVDVSLDNPDVEQIDLFATCLQKSSAVLMLRKRQALMVLKFSI